MKPTAGIAGFVMLIASPGFAYIEQFRAGDLLFEVARVVESRGCSLSQTEWADLFIQKGGHISDFQANILNLYKNNEMSSPDGGKTLVLHKFGKCA